ncbi:hypothetical protein [Absidia glauca]|uniref:Glycerophosphocholine acyltransferase 1 n=1 Tax=Absidia glauca TaxID=4829 RepID=A0A168LDI2_ABSGL|nr:hypothetical protein [Absidia glauca]
MGSPETTPTEDHDDLFDNDLFDEWTHASNPLLSDNDFDMIDRLSAALEQVTHQLNDRQRDLLQRSSEWTQKTRDRLRVQTSKLETRRTLIEQKLLKQYETINARMHKDEKTIHFIDKVSFVVGVGNACITPALAVRAPQWIPLFYTIQSIYLLTLRFVVYKYRRWHYFIFDLCYFVNVMTLLSVWLFPGSTWLFYATYSLTGGPVAWAIVTWRNSLVFHSLDKVTSVFIHIMPALVTFVIRWLPELHPSTDAGLLIRSQRFPALTLSPTMSFKDCMISSTVAYLIWQALYFVFIMVKRREKIEAGLRVTSYSWLLNDTASKKSLIQKAAYVCGPAHKAKMFMLLQLVYNLVTTIPTYFMFKYFWLHTLFLCAMFGASVWNGANYYIEVFSRRYLLEIEQALKKKQKEEDKQIPNGDKKKAV